MGKSNNKFLDKLVSRTKVYLVIIAILLIVICIFKPVLIIPAVLVYACIIAYTYYINQKKMEEVSEQIKDLTFNVDKVSKRTLVNSPFPLVIIETDGSIIWKNKKFLTEFADIKNINKQIKEIIKDVKLEIISGNKKDNQIKQKVNIGNKSYKIVGEYVKSKPADKSLDKNIEKKKEFTATLYFINETELDNLKKDYEDSQICVGITMIDNYEEIIQRTPSDEQLKIFSQVEQKIYEWAAEFGGLVIKAERDTFVWICEQKYIELLEENKFNILDSIKEIDSKIKIPTTLSIAVSCDGESNYDKYKHAKNAIDIALGRGGDQAIIRKNGKFTFYGGRTPEVEKRTRVKARSVANALEELIEEADNIVVMGHSNSDIDALGAALGIYRFAKSMEKPAFIANSTIGVGLENFIDYAKKTEEYGNAFIEKEEALEITNSNTLLVVVDTNKKNYTDIPELLDMAGKVVVIDHHRMSTDYIDNAVLSFQEVYASSAAELVTELIVYSERNIKLSNLEAEALYAGIMMDTKNFTFKTGVRTFEAAAYLRKCGVDIIKVKKWFQSDLNTYNTISEIVSKAEMVEPSIAIAIYDKIDKDANIICAKAADELLTISDITASFVIGNFGEKTCISGRSLGDINVQIIMEKLGGGGHITLAGAQVEDNDTEAVKKQLIEKIKEYFSEQI